MGIEFCGLKRKNQKKRKKRGSDIQRKDKKKERENQKKMKGHKIQGEEEGMQSAIRVARN